LRFPDEKKCRRKRKNKNERNEGVGEKERRPIRKKTKEKFFFGLSNPFFFLFRKHKTISLPLILKKKKGKSPMLTYYKVTTTKTTNTKKE
jgi:hypothetical protein